MTLPPAVYPEASIVPVLAMPLAAVKVMSPPLPVLELALMVPAWVMDPSLASMLMLPPEVSLTVLRLFMAMADVAPSGLPASMANVLPAVLAFSVLVLPTPGSTATTLPALNSAGPTEVMVSVLSALPDLSSAPSVMVLVARKPKACGVALSVDTSAVAGPKVEPSLNFKLLVVPICKAPGTSIVAFFPITTPLGLRR